MSMDERNGIRRRWGTMRETAMAQAMLQFQGPAGPVQCVSWAEVCDKARSSLRAPLFDLRSDPLAEGYTFKWFSNTRRPLIAGGDENLEVRDPTGRPVGNQLAIWCWHVAGDDARVAARVARDVAVMEESRRRMVAVESAREGALKSPHDIMAHVGPAASLAWAEGIAAKWQRYAATDHDGASYHGFGHGGDE